MKLIVALKKGIKFIHNESDMSDVFRQDIDLRYQNTLIDLPAKSKRSQSWISFGKMKMVIIRQR